MRPSDGTWDPAAWDDPSWNHDELLRHAAWVKRLALELVRDPGLAEDLVQETWIATWRSRPRADRSLRPWLARVLRNQAALIRRRGAAREARERESAREESLPGPEEMIQRAEVGQQLAGMLLELEDPYRSTLLWHFYEGLSPTQIAERRGLPAATVRTHLRRGLEQVRERFQREHAANGTDWRQALAPWLILGEIPREASLPLSVPLLVGGALVGLISLAAFLPRWNTADQQMAQGPSPAQITDSSTKAELARSQELTPTRTSPRDARARSTAPSPRRVRLVAENDGAPLGRFAVGTSAGLELADGEGWIDLLPEDGAPTLVGHPSFAQTQRASHGQLTPRELPPLTRPLPADGDDEWRIPAGPAFLLDLPGRRAGVELRARLVAHGDEAMADIMRPRAMARVAEADGVMEEPWVRFPIPADRDRDGLRWDLELRGADGLSFARVEDVDVRPSHWQRISAALQPTGRLSVWPRGAVDGAGFGLRLHGPQGETPVLTAILTGGDGGELEARWLAPGDYRLELHGSRYAPWSRQVEIEAGGQSLELSLQALPEGGALRGEIHSESGSYRGQLLVFLFADDDGRLLGVDPLTWEEHEGRSVAAFEFVDVPRIPCSMDVVSLESAVELTRPRGLLAPRDDVQITLHDQRAACDWQVLAFAGDGDRTIEEFTFEVEIEGRWRRRYQASAEAMPDGSSGWLLQVGELNWNRFSGAAPLRGLPCDTPFQWRLSAEGYRPLEGTSEDFALHDASTRRLSAKLTKLDGNPRLSR